MHECWAAIRGYEGYYEVSNLGRVKSLLFQSNVHNKKYKREKIMRPRGQTYKTGYRVSLWKEGVQRDFLVSRLVAFTFLGEDINNTKLTVNHIDGNRFNNNLDNLELVSLSDNIRHAYETGLMKKVCKGVILVNEKTGDEHEFISMSRASEFLGKNKGYVSGRLKRGRKEFCGFKVKIP